MDIYAHDGSFGVAMGGFDSFLYGWGKDKTLSLKANPKAKYKRPSVSIETGRGDFIEAIDEKGNVVSEGGGGQWYYVEIGKALITLRFKTLPKPDLTKAQMDKARRRVTRHLYSDSPYSLGVNTKLSAAIELLQKKLVEVPKAYRHTAEIEFGSRTSYGESYEHVEITWTEPETDEELLYRLKVEAEHKRRSTENERAQFKKLRDKFCAASK
jgi:hypothetical protein